MATSAQARRARLHPGVAAFVLLLAAVAWTVVLVGQLRTAPARRHIDAGIEYARQGKGIAAQHEWQTAVRLDPNNVMGWDLLGELYLSTGNWASAVGALRRLERLNPDLPRLYTRLALCTLCAGDEPSASHAAEEALRRDPNDESALLIAASALASSGADQQRYLDYLRRLVKLRPDDHDCLMMLAEALAAGHLYVELRPVLEHSLALQPDSPEAYALRGLYRKDTDPSSRGLADAEADFRHALQRNPSDAFSHYNLGKTYQLMGQGSNAVRELEAAQRLTPDKAAIYFDLASAYDGIGWHAQAAQARLRFETLRQQTARISSLGRRCTVNPEDFELHLELGTLYLQAGDYPRATVYLNQALRLRPNDSRALGALQRLASNGPDPSATAQQRLLAAMQGDAARMAGP
jgi:cytochrome c-type biogenesis protein CcmH/NrfG